MPAFTGGSFCRLKDGEEVKPSDKVQIESKPDGTQRLILKDAKAADTGEYRCEAANEAGTAWTEGPLTVKGTTIRCDMQEYALENQFFQSLIPAQWKNQTR